MKINDTVHPLQKIWNKPERLGIGLMSGTSGDGIDAALVKISGSGIETKVQQIGFSFLPFQPEIRKGILKLAEGNSGGASDICRMNFLLGELFAEACEKVCSDSAVEIKDIDFVGSHGQTVYHLPEAETYLGRRVRGTLQIGEAAVIAQRMQCPVVSDFRVKDMAAGGFGAPLVPYTEFLLYRSETKSVALQNIGGIGNITLLPKNCRLSQVIAFDTGPGNMVMDALVSRLSNNKLTYDDGGKLAAEGNVNLELLTKMLKDPYLQEIPPKTTGRERYGEKYVEELLREAAEMGVTMQDTLATATRFTAECIGYAVNHFCRPKPECLIVGGGGSMNPTLMGHIRNCLQECQVLVNEDLGFDSNAKEAVAFAILANEALFANCNNAPSATGADSAVVMGKISL